MNRHVVVLGAGFGGLELVSRLSEAVPDDVEVTLIDKSDSFMFGFSKLDVMFGRRPVSQLWHPYRSIDKPGVTFRQETVLAIDAASRRVVTDGGTYEPDVLVVALGADYDTSATPGLAEDGYEFYSVAGAERARDALAAFAGGAVIVGVLGRFFKCPGARTRRHCSSMIICPGAGYGDRRASISSAPCRCRSRSPRRPPMP